MSYQKNKWTLYDKNVPNEEQPHSFITKRKLENIETGIEKAVTDFQMGTLSKGIDIKCEIIPDENDPSIKRLNIVIPKEVSWIISQSELLDNDIAPTGVSINDIILDSNGNIFEIIIGDHGEYRLNKKINIKGKDSYLEMGRITVGHSPSAEITPDNKLNITLPEPCKSVYDIWLELGNEGTPEDFIESIKGESPDIYKLNTLDEVLNNEKEGMYVDALIIKEMYLKMQELIMEKGINILK